MQNPLNTWAATKPAAAVVYLRRPDDSTLVPVPPAVYHRHEKLLKQSGWQYAGGGVQPHDASVRRDLASLLDAAVESLAPVVPASTKPRLVHVAPWPQSPGGIWTHLWQTTRRLAEVYEVHLVHNGSCRVPDLPGCVMHAAPGAAAEALLAELHPAVLLHHQPGADWGRYAGCPVVWHVHATSGLREPRPTWCEPVAVFANCPADRLGPGWRPAEITVLRQAADETLFRPRLTLGYAGRLSEEKLPLSFCEALAARDFGGALRFLVAGDAAAPGYPQRVRAALAALPGIEWRGAIAHDAMPGFYAELDALIVPSAMDSANLAMLEARACGVPVVCREVDGLPFTADAGVRFAATDAELVAAVAELVVQKIARAAGAPYAAYLDSLLAVLDRATAALPEVDVVLPVYNTPAAWLRECWESVKAQTVPFALYLIDDGSTDPGAVAALDEIAADPRVTLLRFARNRGVSAARNRAVRLGRNALIAFLDADDRMRPARLAVQAAALRADPGLAILGAQLQVFGDGPATVTRHPLRPAVADLLDLRWRVNMPAVMLRRDALERLGGFDETLSAGEDADLWARAARAGLELRNLPDVLLDYRAHPGQATRAPDFAARLAAVAAKHGTAA